MAVSSVLSQWLHTDRSSVNICWTNKSTNESTNDFWHIPSCLSFYPSFYPSSSNESILNFLGSRCTFFSRVSLWMVYGKENQSSSSQCTVGLCIPTTSQCPHWLFPVLLRTLWFHPNGWVIWLLWRLLCCQASLLEVKSSLKLNEELTASRC